jgi:hypothetical protein
MKISIPTKRNRAMTLIEVLVVMITVLFLAVVFLPAIKPRPIIRALRVQCINNLKQTALAARVWAGDNNDKFPWQISSTNGGTMEFTTRPNVWRHYQVMSNELSTPRVMICPADDRFAATNFIYLNNSNVSFFIGVDATQTNAAMIFAGDHNLTNGMPVRNGILNLTTNRLTGWTAEVHNKVGNIAPADGSVQQVSISGLLTTVANTGVASNRLQMPILGSSQ